MAQENALEPAEVCLIEIEENATPEVDIIEMKPMSLEKNTLPVMSSVV